MLEEIAQFFPLDSLTNENQRWTGEKVGHCLFGSTLAIKLKNLLPKGAQVEKYGTYEFRASKSMVVIAAKDTATSRTPSLYEGQLEEVGAKGEMRVSLCHNDWGRRA